MRPTLEVITDTEYTGPAGVVRNGTRVTHLALEAHVDEELPGIFQL